MTTMVMVYPRLYVGTLLDYEYVVSKEKGWAVVQACKEPCHREALGYRNRSADKDHPEYLVARRDDRLILNMIDVEDPSYFSREMIDQALDFITEQLNAWKRVFIHCNQGESRAPSIALLYMATRLHALPELSLDAAIFQFRRRYCFYHPRKGIYGHLQQNWDYYVKKGADSYCRNYTSNDNKEK